MKALTALFLCIALCFGCFGATCEDLPAEAEPFTYADASETIDIAINGQPTTLYFDPSDEYSFIENGSVQASFFAYTADRKYLYELYIIYPENVQPGTVITPEYAMTAGSECSAVLVLSDNYVEQYFFAGVANGVSFPNDESLSIRIDAVTVGSDGTSFEGVLTATPEAISTGMGEPLASFAIENAPFKFTIPAVQPDATAPSDAPSELPEDLPDDFANVLPDPNGDDRPEIAETPAPTAAPRKYRV